VKPLLQQILQKILRYALSQPIIIALSVLLLVAVIVTHAYEVRLRWKDAELQMRPAPLQQAGEQPPTPASTAVPAEIHW
jgi:hypothetical protein